MDNIYDSILEKIGINYEDLNPEERSIYNKANFATQSLTVADIKSYVGRMKSSVGLQLAQTPEGDGANAVLKARLQNYTLLEMFLMVPELAQQAMEKQKSLAKKVKE